MTNIISECCGVCSAFVKARLILRGNTAHMLKAEACVSHKALHVRATDQLWKGGRGGGGGWAYGQIQKKGQPEQVLNCSPKRPEILEGGAQVYGTRHCPLCVCRRHSSVALLDFILFYLILSVPPISCSSRDQRSQEGTLLKRQRKEKTNKTQGQKLFNPACGGFSIQTACAAFTCTYEF